MGKLGMGKGQKTAAFFDVDRTLIRRDSQALEAVYLLKKGPFSLTYGLQLLATLVGSWLSRAGLISMDLQNQIYITTYRGRSQRFLNRAGQVLFQDKISREFIPGSLELLEAHRQRGDAIVLVSASPLHLVGPIERYLGADGAFCTRLSYDDNGLCTGRALGPVCIHGEKKKIVELFAKEEGIDLANSHAYSDHHADIPFLDAVGHPVCINPSRLLDAHARKQGWPRHYF